MLNDQTLKPKTLYYIHDPMCSWCWGFRPTWLEIQTSLPSRIQIKTLLGGLAPDSNEPMPKALQLEIASYWRKIQAHIPNTKFNFDFWKHCQPRRSTYPACRAVIAAKKQHPDHEAPMINAIQEAYYLKAKNPSNDDVLIELAKTLGLNTQQFTLDLNSQETQQTLNGNILLAQKIGARGFPSLILETQAGEFLPVPLDYNDAAVSLRFINATQ